MPEVLTLEDYDKQVLSLDAYDRGIRPQEQPQQGFMDTLSEKITPTPESVAAMRTMLPLQYRTGPEALITDVATKILDQPQQLATAGVAAISEKTFEAAYKEGLRPSDLMNVKNEWAKFGIDVILDPLNIPILKVAQIGLKAAKATKNIKNAEKIVAFIEKINKTDPEIVRKLKEDDLIAAFADSEAAKKIDKLEANLKFVEDLTETKKPEALRPAYKLEDIKEIGLEDAKAAFEKRGLEADQIIKKMPEKKAGIVVKEKEIPVQVKPKRDFLTAEEVVEKPKGIIASERIKPATRITSPAETLAERQIADRGRTGLKETDYPIAKRTSEQMLKATEKQPEKITSGTLKVTPEGKVIPKDISHVVQKEIEIPKFTKKSKTEDAIEFGTRHKENKEIIENLKQKELELSQTIKKTDDLQKRIDIVHEKQMYREAHEAATGTGGVGEYLAKTEKSGKDFAKGALKAIKEDILSKKTGIVYNPYQHLDEFLNSAKLKLTREENVVLIKNIQNIARKKLISSEQKEKMVLNEFNKIRDKKLNEINVNQIEDAVLASEYKGEKYAGSLNLHNLNTEDQVKSAMKQLEKGYREKLNLARTGGLHAKTSVIKDIEVRKLADQMGMDADDLIAKKGKTFTEAEALASREINQKSSIAVKDAWHKFHKSKNPKDRLEALTVTANHLQIMEAYMGGASRAGRTLRQYRGLVQDGLVDIDKLMLKLKKSNLDVNFEKLAERLSLMDADDIVGINKLLKDVVIHNNWDKLYEFWINSILSNPTTHIVNTVSNSLVFATRPIEKIFAAGVDIPRALITGKPRERFFSEILPRHAAEGFGFTSGLKEGGRRAVFAWKNEMVAAEASKLELNKIYGAIGGKKGRFIRTPGRALMAADEFFKGINQTAMTHTLAVRKARKAGYKGKVLKQKIAEYVQNPDVEIAAEAEALYRTFTNPLGKAGQKIADLRQIPFVKYIIPFVRTPLNIAKFGLQRTPLALGRTLYKIAKKQIKGGEISEELGRMLMGSTIGYTTFMYALEGGVTGSGPTNRGQRDALRRTGWQPYSIKVGDTHYSYQRFEPLGMVLGTAADFAESFDQMDDNEKFDIATKIATSIGQNLLNKTFMQGLSDAMNAITYPERYGEKWTQRFVSSFNPNIIAGTARALDPEIKQANTVLEKIKSRTPGLTQQLIPRLNLWGEPLKRENVGILAFSPMYISSASKNSVDQEMIRLNMGTNLPGKRINNVELSNKHYNEYVRAAGFSAKAEIKELLKTKDYKSVNDDKKTEMIDKIIRDRRTRARERLGIKLGLYDPTKSKSVYVRAQYIMKELENVKDRDERIKKYREFKKSILTSAVKKELKKQGFRL